MGPAFGVLPMRFGFRIPSLRKRAAARSSPARFLRHSLGLKAPRGWGWLTNPKKALYNRVYRRTTFGVEDLVRPGRRSGCVLLIAGGLFWYVVAEVVHALVW